MADLPMKSIHVLFDKQEKTSFFGFAHTKT